MKTIDSKSLVKIFRDEFGVFTKCQDANYMVASSEWFEREFFPWHEDVLAIVKADKWKTNHDCDNKAIGLLWLAGVCHGQQEESSPEGIAVGIVEYKVDGNGWHAINIAIVDEFEIRFIEPQSSKWVELSEAEKNSIRFILF